MNSKRQLGSNVVSQRSIFERDSLSPVENSIKQDCELTSDSDEDAPGLQKVNNTIDNLFDQHS